MRMKKIEDWEKKYKLLFVLGAIGIFIFVFLFIPLVPITLLTADNPYISGYMFYVAIILLLLFFTIPIIVIFSVRRRRK